MTSHAARYLQNESQVEQSSALAVLLKLTAADPHLSEEDKAQVESAIAKTEHSTKTLLSTYRERLKKTHSAYPEPRKTFLDAITDYEKYKNSVRETIRAEIEAEGEEGARARDRHYLLGDGTLHEPIVEEMGAFYALNPATGDKYPDPIAYPHEIEWAHFAKYVKRNPYTKTLDLHRTLMKFMEVGKKKGLTRKQLMEVNKLLLFHEKPENWTSVSLSEDPFRVFEVILGLIDYTSHLQQLRVALKKVSRRPEECIQSVIYCYANIVNELLQVQTPDSTEDQNESLSQKEAARAIQHFVTPEMWNEVKLFKEMYKTQHDLNTAPLSAIFDFINDTESSYPNMRPKVTMTMSHNIQVDLFLTEQSRHHSWQLGDPNPQVDSGEEDGEQEEEDQVEEGVYLAESEPGYENWPPGSGHGLPSYGGGYPSSGSLAEGSHSVHMASSTKPPSLNSTHAMSLRSSGNATYGPGDFRRKRQTKKSSKLSASMSQPTSAPGSSLVKTPSGPRAGSPSSAGTSSKVSHHSSAGMTGRPNERGRTQGQGIRPVSPGNVTQFSPNTGRRRYYASSPGGRVYSVPRNNLYTLDDDKKLRPRSRTPSKDRGNEKKNKRCETCDRKYVDGVKHICDYGKLKADKVCTKCRRGKHPVSVCLGVSASRSPSREPNKKGDRMLPKGFNDDLN